MNPITQLTILTILIMPIVRASDAPFTGSNTTAAATPSQTPSESNTAKVAQTPPPAASTPQTWTVKGKKITAGMTKDQVRKILGKPITTGDSMKSNESVIWIYQGAQIANSLESEGVGLVGAFIPFGGMAVGNAATPYKSDRTNWDVIFGNDGTVIDVRDQSSK
jgi:hypothetical protein